MGSGEKSNDQDYTPEFPDTLKVLVFIGEVLTEVTIQEYYNHYNT